MKRQSNVLQRLIAGLIAAVVEIAAANIQSANFISNMRPLLAIVSCNAPKFRLRADAQRSTWVPAAQEHFDIRFFVGGDAEAERDDIVVLPVADDYLSLPFKVQYAIRWALQHGYARFVKVDDDTYVSAADLARTVLTSVAYDYVGRFRGASGGRPHSYASGAGYILSKRAMETAGIAPVTDTSEDRWIGGILTKVYRADARYDFVHLGSVAGKVNPWKPPNSALGYASVLAEFTPEGMIATHKMFVRWRKDYLRQSRMPPPRFTSIS